MHAALIIATIAVAGAKPAIARRPGGPTSGNGALCRLGCNSQDEKEAFLASYLQRRNQQRRPLRTTVAQTGGP